MPSELDPLLLGLLLVAAALGYLVARLTARRPVERRDRGVHPDYLKGLNYLLNDETDRAIDVFVRMVEVDSETVETHFALGSLFRRRGEVDRAIRIHQNLIARPNLPRLERQQALFELGEDYMRAGLQDRAENLFRELVDTPRYRRRALEQLASIYEQQKDWEQAIQIRRRLQVIKGADERRVIAHYLCEQAELAGNARDAKSMRQLVRKALQQDKASSRAQLLQAGVDEAEGDARAAAKAYRRLLAQDPGLAVIVLPSLRRVLPAEEREHELAAAIQAVVAAGGPAARADIVLALVADQDLESPAVLDTFRAWVDSEPAFTGVLRLVGDGDGEDQRLLGAVRSLLAGRPLYRCTECGFPGHVHYWLCPSCQRWDSTRPVSLAGGLFPEPEEGKGMVV